MGYGWQELFWSGFVATAVAATFAWIPRSFAWTRFNPSSALGCLVFSDPRDPKTETFGLLLLFVLGAGAFPYLYAQLFQAIGSIDWMSGVLVGLLHGVLTAAVLPAFGSVSPCVRSGRLTPPGQLGLAWGRATPAAIVGGHVTYAVVLAAVLAHFGPVAGP
jgi:hypothetical protein